MKRKSLNISSVFVPVIDTLMPNSSSSPSGRLKRQIRSGYHSPSHPHRFTVVRLLAELDPDEAEFWSFSMFYVHERVSGAL